MATHLPTSQKTAGLCGACLAFMLYMTLEIMML